MPITSISMTTSSPTDIRGSACKHDKREHCVPRAGQILIEQGGQPKLVFHI